jgi:hypothetical protein
MSFACSGDYSSSKINTRTEQEGQEEEEEQLEF